MLRLLPIFVTLFAWWFSTGLLLYLDGLPRRTYRWSIAGASALLCAALYVLAAERLDTTVVGAYAAFMAALLIWAWNEMTFLMGFVTGPSRAACPADARGVRRFIFAAQTVIHHELAILASGTLVIGLTWDAPNRVGLWTFLILWTMRLSAKLNLFFGVPNLGAEFLPDHMKYLGTYFVRKAMNNFFPVAVTAATVAAALFFDAALSPAASEFTATGLTIAGTLLSLAVLEHWFMVAPFQTSALWAWSFRSRAIGGIATSPDTAAVRILSKNTAQARRGS